ncbi:unnamed protein product, partial [Staurois parvus]
GGLVRCSHYTALLYREHALYVICLSRVHTVYNYMYTHLFVVLQPVIPTSPTSGNTTPTGTMGMPSKVDSSTLHDVFILSPVSGLYGPRDDIGMVSCDDINKYGVTKMGMKGSESPSYFLEHESGKYYTLIEGDLRPVSMPTDYSWIGDPKEPNMYKRGSRDSENSLLRYLSDDKILVIQEEPLTQKDNKKDTGRRSRKKSKNPGSPSYPISPSMLTSSGRLDPAQQDSMTFSMADNNTVPLYHRATDTIGGDTDRYSSSAVERQGNTSMRKTFHYASLRVKTKKRSKGGSLTSGSRRRISCKDLGHGDCEGWLWKKKDAK